MERRVAIITDANMHVGPDLAIELAERGHDLVLGEPAEGLADKLEAMGATVETVTGVADLSREDAVPTLVKRALDRFGRLDAACIRTGKIIRGDIFGATLEELHLLSEQNIASVFHALRALLPPMVERRNGQVVIVTSATGTKPQPAAALYSATRAAANMLVRNAAKSVAKEGVTVNAIGTNFLDYPGFVNANRADDPAVRAKLEALVPVGRLGECHEIAHFCASLLDGVNRFQTGQFFSLSGGWSE